MNTIFLKPAKGIIMIYEPLDKSDWIGRGDKAQEPSGNEAGWYTPDLFTATPDRDK